MSRLKSSQIHALVGASQRLRDETLPGLIADWTGPVKRVGELADPQRLILDLDTASIFEESSLWLVRAGSVYLRKHQSLFAPLAGKPAGGGVIVLLAYNLDKRGELAKALIKAKVLHELPEPGEKGIIDWLTPRLAQVPQGVHQPRQVAAAFVQHFGAEIDALLSGLDAVATYCGGERITAKAVDDVCGATASRPIWDFTGAFYEGDAKRAIELLHAGDGIEPEQAMGAITNELRKMLACEETANDSDACSIAGIRGRPSLYYTRGRAQALGKNAMLRLFSGALWAQRQLRQSGQDRELAVESLVLHAQKIIKASAR
jgi:DNA polymerase III delta subunit